jgi:hypothetical protein
VRKRTGMELIQEVRITGAHSIPHQAIQSSIRRTTFE